MTPLSGKAIRDRECKKLTPPVGQMRMLVSQLALAKRTPSGLTAMLVTASVCSLHAQK